MSSLTRSGNESTPVETLSPRAGPASPLIWLEYFPYFSNSFLISCSSFSWEESRFDSPLLKLFMSMPRSSAER